MEQHLDDIEIEAKDPMVIFRKWLGEAKSLPENYFAETMTLSTVGRNGGPSSRMVLLRGLDPEGFQMFWDMRSKKSQEINVDSRGALVFGWAFQREDGELAPKQVRIEGLIEKMSRDEDIEYFKSEPSFAQIRAAVCHQSRVIPSGSRTDLLNASKHLLAQVERENLSIEIPEHYGGFRLKPLMMEFYRSSASGINARVRFRKTEEGVLEGLPIGTFQGNNGWVYEHLEP